MYVHVLCTVSMVVVGSKMGAGVYMYILYRDGNTGEECKVLSTPLSPHDNITIPLTKYIVGHLSKDNLSNPTQDGYGVTMSFSFRPLSRDEPAT